MIKIGNAIPNVKMQILMPNGLQDVSTDKIFQGNVIMFGIPGAYTPSCSEKHLPGFLQTADTLKKSGIDQIVCLSVNDPFTLHAWGREKQVKDKILMLPDGNGEFTRALGLELDGSSLSLGTRCKRFSMMSENGIVKDLQVEENFVDVDVTSALCMLGRLGIA